MTKKMFMVLAMVVVFAVSGSVVYGYSGGHNNGDRNGGYYDDGCNNGGHNNGGRGRNHNRGYDQKY